MTKSALPDDVIHEIFLRLHDDGDVFALFRCAVTCKRWRRLVAGSSFLRRRWPSSLLGFFAQRCPGRLLPGTSPTDAGTSLAFVTTGRSAALNGDHPSHRPLSSLVRDAPDYLDRSVPLASRGSLLLVRLFSGDHDLESNVARLAVCDLLAGRCYVLPELDCNSRFGYYDNSYGYAILSSRAGDYPYYSDDDKLSPTFGVLMIGQDKHEARYNLHVFTFGEQGWSAPIECFDTMERQVSSMIHANAVVCRGYAHWLFSNCTNFYVLNFNVETRRVSLTKLLNPTPRNWVHDGHYMMDFVFESLPGLFIADRLTTTADGRLLTLCMYRKGCRVEMWTQQEDDDGKQSKGGVAEWLQTWVIDFGQDELMKLGAACTCLGERSGRLLIVDYRCRLYIADPETGALEEVTQQFRGHAYNRIVPVEIDWPTFQDRWA